MKPRIWKRSFLPGWACGETYLSPIVGFGNTPANAYFDWKRKQSAKIRDELMVRNLLNPDLQILGY